ncbi:MAG TPA: hypothetical protein VFB33_16880 [Candidatus Binataceae bacterium]|jgi:hypothetical protein|nr:hypothetical protein [Candidatus Binataceae bacterium]
MAMDMGPRTRAAILSLLLLATAAGCGETAAARAATARRNFVLAQQYRKQALAANERGDSARATQYLQQAQMHEPVGEQASLPPSTTMLLPQHRAIAPASGPVTCHTIGINRFSCF